MRTARKIETNLIKLKFLETKVTLRGKIEEASPWRSELEIRERGGAGERITQGGETLMKEKPA